MKKILVAAVTVVTVVFAKVPSAECSPSYYCYKTERPIRIDGRLNERAWKDVPFVECRGLVDGSTPKYSTKVKMLWDEQYLYVGFNVEDPNVWAVVKNDIGEPKEVWTVSPQAGAKYIMLSDSFLKVYLDPDGDGKNYMEFHINPLNNMNDMRIEHGSTRRDRQELDLGPENYHIEWDCAGLKSAVHIQGTLNNPKDTDKGWSTEIAIPWASLSSFSFGKCPPVSGDVWRVHLGRAYRSKVKGKRTYWTWPVIGVLDCHQLDRYGFVIFSEDPAIKKSSPKEQLSWKMVWSWTMGDKSDTEIVASAKSLGFNAIQARSKNMVEECHKVGMEAIAQLWFSSAPKDLLQVMLPEEEERLKQQAENLTVKDLYQEGGEPIQGGEVHTFNPLCLDRPKALEFAKQRIDTIIAAGYDGIGFDGIGYRNYNACFCPISRMKQEEFWKKHPELSREQAIRKYSEECLVSFYGTLVTYAKEKKPDIKTICHIYPHFAPNPLYGNKLPVDYCGQTVSWFFLPHWSLDKIERYTYEAVNHEAQFHPNSESAPFIGIYTLSPFERHRKSVRQVREEIRTVKKSGAKAIQFAELGNILNDAEIANVVREELGGSWKNDQ